MFTEQGTFKPNTVEEKVRAALSTESCNISSFDENNFKKIFF